MFHDALVPFAERRIIKMNIGGLMTKQEKYLVCHIISEYGERLQQHDRLPKPPNSHSATGCNFVVIAGKCTKFERDNEGYYCAEGIDLWYREHFEARVLCDETSFDIELKWDLPWPDNNTTEA